MYLTFSRGLPQPPCWQNPQPCSTLSFLQGSYPSPALPDQEFAHCSYLTPPLVEHQLHKERRLVHFINCCAPGA